MQAFRLLLCTFLFCISIGVSAQTTYHVDSASTGGGGLTWGTAFTTLDSALHVASAEDTIKVAKGTYMPTLFPQDCPGCSTNGRDSAFQLVDSVIMLGGYPTGGSATRSWSSNPVILSGDLGATGSAYHVIVGVNLSDETIVDGFTIQDGNANGGGSNTIDGITVQRNRGGGIYLRNSSPVFRNIVVVNNISSNRGGGMAILGNSSAPTIVNAVIVNNETTGANGGGGIHNSGDPVLRNVTVFNNTASNVSGGGGGMLNAGGSAEPDIANSVFWANTDTATTGDIRYTNTGADTMITYSLLQVLFPGTGNITGNPLFVNQADPDGTDNIWMTADDGLHIQKISPAVDTGDNGSIPAGIAADIIGSARTQNSTVDLGAYETAPCVDPTKPTLTAAPDTVCPDSSSVISITGDLNDAMGWTVRADSCNGTFVGQTTGMQFIVDSLTTTGWYYIRGEGGCISMPGECDSVFIVVEDSIAPVVTCLTDTIFAPLDSFCRLVIPDYTDSAYAVDNCNDTLGLVQIPAVNDTIYADTSIMLIATDSSGLSDTCEIVLILEDTIHPSIDCPTGPLTGYFQDTCVVIIGNYKDSATVWENCGIDTIIQIPDSGTIVTMDTMIKLIVVDSAGLKDSCTFSLQVQDTTPPTITCNQMMDTLYFNDTCWYEVPDLRSLADAVDSCTKPPTIAQFPVATSVMNDTSFTLELIALDAALNTDTCTVLIKVLDTIPPVITCPANDTGYVNDTCGFVVPDYTDSATVTDNCGDTMMVSQIPPIDTVFTDVDSVIISLIATDSSGNADTCMFTVYVKDTIPPVITCKADTIGYIDTSCFFTVPNYTSRAIAMDFCDTALVTQLPAVGTKVSDDFPVRLIATDSSGNSDTCIFQVSLIDTVGPVATCLGDTFGYFNDTCAFVIGNYKNLIATSGPCLDSIIVIQVPDSGMVVKDDTIFVDLIAEDTLGKRDTCTIMVTVTDTTPPDIVCPSGPFTGYFQDSCVVVVGNYKDSATLTENCGIDTIIQIPDSGTIITANTMIKLIVVDSAGLKDSCTFLLQVQDTTPPTITCNAAMDTLYFDGSCKYTIPDLTGLASAVDSCTTNPAIFHFPAIGAMQSDTSFDLTLIARDVAGNEDTCIVRIKVLDTIPPVITCPGLDTGYFNDTCGFVVPDYTDSAMVTDNCGDTMTITQIPDVDSVITGMDSVTIKLIATDSSGNADSCEFTVRILDTLPPAITYCGTDTIGYVDSTCFFTVPDYMHRITAADNCDTAIIAQLPPIGTKVNDDFPVRLIVTDSSNNRDTCIFIVRLLDTIGPGAICLGDTSGYFNDTCGFVIGNYKSLIDTSGPCGDSLIITQIPDSGMVVKDDTIFVDLIAEDTAGMKDTCTIMVTVTDTTPPDITCPAGPYTGYFQDSCVVVVGNYRDSAMVMDNCGWDSIIQIPNSGAIVTTDTMIKLIAVDSAGLKDSCTFLLQLQDSTPPTIICSQMMDTIYFDNSCVYTVPNLMHLASAVDSCTQNPIIFHSPPVGVPMTDTSFTLYLIAQDDAGNEDTCTVLIKVHDTIPPAITCPRLDTGYFNDTCGFVVPDYRDSAMVTDNCADTMTITQIPDVDSVVTGMDSVTVKLIATDSSGNTDTCEFTVRILDTLPPTITYCGTDTIGYVDSTCFFTVPDYMHRITAADGCDTAIILQLPPIGTKVNDDFPVRLIAADSTGNKDTCIFIVRLIDTIAPQITCPDTVYGYYTDSCWYVVPDFTDSVSAVDNCDTGITISQIPSPGDTLYADSVITLIAVDDSLFADTCDIVLILQDSTPPEIDYCPPNMTEYFQDDTCIFVVRDYVFYYGINGTDNCAFDSIQQIPAPGDTVNSNFTAMLIAVDSSGNTSDTCMFVVTLQDSTPPVFLSCPMGVLLQIISTQIAVFVTVPNYTQAWQMRRR